MALAAGDVVAHSAGARVRTAAFAALLAAGIVVEVAARWNHRPTGAVLLLGTIGVCAAALVRRRFPARAAAAAIVLCAATELIDWRAGRQGQPAPVACLALLVVVASAMRSVRHPAGVAAVAAGSGVVAAGTVERYATFIDQGVPNAWSATLVMVAGWAVAVTAGLWLRVADARRRAAVEAARRTERLALARDLHDVAAHHLTGLVIQAQVAQLGTGDRKASDEAFAEIETAGSQALASLRQVVRVLRTDDVDAPGSLAELVSAFAAPGIRARLVRSGGPLPPELTVAVYRIVQESLTNTARHARGASAVTVTLLGDGPVVRLRIADDGRAVPGEPGGHGIIGMRERAVAFGGSLTAGPGPTGGWVVEAVLPTPSLRGPS